MSLRTLYCPECRADRLFERPHDGGEGQHPGQCPDRADSPDGLCPELACIDCGAARYVGFALPITVRTRGVPRQHSPGRAA
jgi:hypothetical protein